MLFLINDGTTLVIQGGDIGVVMKAQALVSLLHNAFHRSCGWFVLAEHKQRWAGAGNTASQRTGFLAFSFYSVKAWNQDAAYGFNDDVLQRTANKVVVALHEAGHQARNVAPLLDGIFQ